MAHAQKGAVFMHCLPARRGEEVTDEVIDGPQSVVVQQAANRMHVQKGILAWLLGHAGRRSAGNDRPRSGFRDHGVIAIMRPDGRQADELRP